MTWYVQRETTEGQTTSVGPFEDLEEAERVLAMAREYADKHGFKDDQLYVLNTGACDVD